MAVPSHPMAKRKDGTSSARPRADSETPGGCACSSWRPRAAQGPPDTGRQSRRRVRRASLGGWGWAGTSHGRDCTRPLACPSAPRHVPRHRDSGTSLGTPLGTPSREPLTAAPAPPAPGRPHLPLAQAERPSASRSTMSRASSMRCNQFRLPARKARLGGSMSAARLPVNSDCPESKDSTRTGGAAAGPKGSAAQTRRANGRRPTPG